MTASGRDNRSVNCPLSTKSRHAEAKLEDSDTIVSSWEKIAGGINHDDLAKAMDGSMTMASGASSLMVLKSMGGVQKSIRRSSPPDHKMVL